MLTAKIAASSKKFLAGVLIATLFMAFFAILVPSASAAPILDPEGGPSAVVDADNVDEGACGNVKNSAQLQNCVEENSIVKDIRTIINFLSVGVGIIIVGVLIYGGIHYMIAGDNAQETVKARHRITNGLIALLVYLVTFAFLQWLVPGGVFN